MSEEMKTKPVGRPPDFSSAEEMQKKIDEYFEFCKGEILYNSKGEMILDRNNRPVKVNRRPLTITGLALALGFNSRQSLLNYEGKPEFLDTIKRAKSRVEQYAEERLFDKDGSNGAKFSLANNFKGWSEKQQIEASVDNTVTINVELVDDEEE